MLELKCDYKRINNDGKKIKTYDTSWPLASVRWRESRKNIYMFTKNFYLTYTVEDFVVCYIAFQLIEVSLVGNLG